MPTLDKELAMQLFFGALVSVLLYFKVRRTLGRQKLRSRILQFRVGLMSLVAAVMPLSPSMTSQSLLYAAAGAVIGLGVAVFALRHTRFEVTEEGVFYTLHVYIGVAVSALLISRLFYRFWQMGPAMRDASAGAQPHIASSLSSPTTLAAFYLMVGYFVVYYGGLLVSARRLSQPA